MTAKPFIKQKVEEEQDIHMVPNVSHGLLAKCKGENTYLYKESSLWLLQTHPNDHVLLSDHVSYQVSLSGTV